MVKSTHLVEGMATLGHDVRFLSGQTKAEREWLEADRAVLLVFRGVVAGHDRERSMGHGSEGVDGEVLGMEGRGRVMSVRVGRDKGAEGGRGGSWIRLVCCCGVERGGGEVIGLGRTVGLVRFLEPSGGMSDPHKTGETVTGGDEKELAGDDYNNCWNNDN
jgi:hypothetical protein